MLVISRKVGESIIIGEGRNRAEIRVIEIQPQRVRLGCMADKTIPIVRDELEQKQCEWCQRLLDRDGDFTTYKGTHYFCSVDCKLDCLAHYDADERSR